MILEQIQPNILYKNFKNHSTWTFFDASQDTDEREDGMMNDGRRVFWNCKLDKDNWHIPNYFERDAIEFFNKKEELLNFTYKNGDRLELKFRPPSLDKILTAKMIYSSYDNKWSDYFSDGRLTYKKFWCIEKSKSGIILNPERILPKKIQHCWNDVNP